MLGIPHAAATWTGPSGHPEEWRRQELSSSAAVSESSIGDETRHIHSVCSTDLLLDAEGATWIFTLSMACVRGDAEALVHGASCKETRMTRTG